MTTIWVLDRTKVLHGPRTQTYEKTNDLWQPSGYQAEPKFALSTAIAWSSDQTTERDSRSGIPIGLGQNYGTP